MGAFSDMCNKASFRGQKSNLHKLILNDFENIANNIVTVQVLNYKFLQRN